VQGLVTAGALLQTDSDTIELRRLGINEHRYRSLRLYRQTDGTGGWTWHRHEPWKSTLVDANPGQVLGWSATATPPASAPGWAARSQA
jgi:hypothetical protein